MLRRKLSTAASSADETQTSRFLYANFIPFTPSCPLALPHHYTPKKEKKKFAHEKKLNLQGNLPTVEGQEEVRRFIVFFHPIFSIFLPFHFSRSEVFLVEKRRRTREEKRRTRLCECRKTSE
jgi:hypothetical protein